MNTITRNKVLDTLTQYFLPHLLKTEDFDTFIRDVGLGVRGLSQEAIGQAIEQFDNQIKKEVPLTWEVKDRPCRSIITVLGKVTYTRTLFLDEYGRPRYLTDEILGIRKHTRYSDDAFLWIVTRAASVSFRTTAKDFKALSGESVSHVTVMKMVHAEGSLLKEYLLNAHYRENSISQANLFAESDGVFIALQSPEKRKIAIERHLYEKQRQKKSNELKCVVSYAGKIETSEPTRRKRGNVLAACTVLDTDELFEICAKDIDRHYLAEDIDTIVCGSDGAAHYKEDGLDEIFPKISRTHVLDPFHVMRSLTTAFPDKALKSKMLSLIYAKEFEGFSALCSYLFACAESEAEQNRIAACKSYIFNNESSINMHADLGTMEGTIAHIWAKRMKNNGTSWSKHGMEAMGLVRAFVCTGRSLIAPSKQVFFSEAEITRKENFIQDASRDRSESAGSGYCPVQGKIHHTKRTASYMSILSGVAIKTRANR